MTQPVMILLGVGGFVVAIVLLNLILTGQRQLRLKRDLIANWGKLPVKRGGSERSQNRICLPQPVRQLPQQAL